MEGKSLAAHIRRSVKKRVEQMIEERGRAPHLVAVTDNSYASQVYLKEEIKACKKAMISTEIRKIDQFTQPKDFISLLKKLSADPRTDAILVTQPLPYHLRDICCLQHINPLKDVDGAGTISNGLLFSARNLDDIESGKFFVPCTALAVLRLLKYYSVELDGARVAVIGRSNAVGKPLVHLLTCADATVTICHSRTKHLSKVLKANEIIISAVGKPGFLTANKISKGAIVIDVGMNEGENRNICGDANYDELREITSAISPVPGGVGPVTLACLLENIIRAAENI